MPLNQSVIRISKEIGDIQRGSDLSIAVACRDIDVRNVRALIIGPHETPYEFGFFEFAIKFGTDYPSKSPSVVSVTTNNGMTRFNPNIYASGKVCLSILGTWRGERGEEWSSAQGLESILLSIQSLMSSNPYENEPGFERTRSENDKKNQKAYVDKIQHETIRLAVLNRLEKYLGLDATGAAVEPPRQEAEDLDQTNVPFEPFQDLCKQRFIWYFHSYMMAIEKGEENEDAAEGTAFSRMPFELSNSNGMDGTFKWSSLKKRLQNVKAAIEKETEAWAKEGMEAVARDSTVAANLRHQFEQVSIQLKNSDIPHDITLEHGNPFVWILTYFGRPMTNLDGGLFRIKISFSPRFPEEQPRVKLETKIFHHLVTPDGNLCYTPRPERREDVKTHIEAIISVLEEDDPAYDPRKLVHPEACQLYWNGGKDNKKIYNRRLRRSVQQSMEDFPE